MFKSILAVSEGGPDAGMSFKLAARVAGLFDGCVDALHLPVGPAGGMVGGLAMSGEAMPPSRVKCLNRRNGVLPSDAQLMPR